MSEFRVSHRVGVSNITYWKRERRAAKPAEKKILNSAVEFWIKDRIAKNIGSSKFCKRQCSDGVGSCKCFHSLTSGYKRTMFETVKFFMNPPEEIQELKHLSLTSEGFEGSYCVEIENALEDTAAWLFTAF
jgi:hypothetical protein